MPRSDGTSAAFEPIKRREFSELDRAQVQDRVAHAVETDPQPFFDRYRNFEESFGGHYVSADLFKETFDAYRASNAARNRYNSPTHNSAAVLAARQLQNSVHGLNGNNIERGRRNSRRTAKTKHSCNLNAATTRTLVYELEYRNLGRHPPHNRNRADRVLGASLDKAVAVRHVNEHVSRSIVKADHVQLLEQQAAPLIEHGLTVFQIARHLDRANLAAGDAGIAGIFRESQPSLDATRDRATDMTGHTFHLGIIEAIDDDPVVGPQPAESRADLAGRAPFGSVPYPEYAYQQ